MSSESLERATETRCSVLVVDDDPVLLEIAKLLLAPMGLEVDTAQNGLLGLASARSKPYELVILDINMPGMDGIELATALRADPLTASIQIIIQTSLEEGWVRARFADYDAFVSKPPAAVSLVDIVSTLLVKRHRG